MTSILHHHHGLALPPDRDVIKVWMDDDDKSLYCNEFGRVHDWQPQLQSSHRMNNHGTCIHRLRPMEQTQLFCPHWVSLLNWQSQLITKSAPVIASRRGDIVTIGFNKIGPIRLPNGYTCTESPGPIAENRWHYRLHPIQWWDEAEPADNVLLGVWVD
jgi:hypothetical protein